MLHVMSVSFDSNFQSKTQVESLQARHGPQRVSSFLEGCSVSYNLLDLWWPPPETGLRATDLCASWAGACRT